MAYNVLKNVLVITLHIWIVFCLLKRFIEFHDLMSAAFMFDCETSSSVSMQVKGFFWLRLTPVPWAARNMLHRTSTSVEKLSRMASISDGKKYFLSAVLIDQSIQQ